MVLQNIRDRLNGIIAIFILGLLIIPFAFVGVSSYFTSGAVNNVAVVNDQEITVAQYTQSFQNYRRRMQSMLGTNFDPEYFDQAIGRRQHLETIIDRFGGVGEEVDLSRGYIVVMQHPVTTEHQQARRHVEETLNAVTTLELPALWFWPNVDAGSDGTSKGIRAFRELHDLPHIHFFKNLPPEEFLQLLYHSRCIVGNSSVAVRECAYLGVPAVNIGNRQNGRDRGRNIVDVDYDRDQIKTAIESQINAPRLESDLLYGDGNAGSRIAEILSTVPLGIEKQLSY